VSAGDCDLYIDQLPAAPATPAQLLAAAFVAGHDPWAERALARAPLDLDAAGRMFRQRLPLVPLFHRAVRVHHRSTLRGVRLDAGSRLPMADLFFFTEATP
jgi:hypothetical protein